MNLRTILFLAALCLHAPLFSATLTWDGNTGESGLQDGAGSWNLTDINRWYNAGALPPDYQAWSNANADIAVFGSGSGTAGTVTLGTAITVGGLTFNAAGTGNYTLSGNVLTLAGTPVITTNVDATITSALAGTAGFTKTGAGNLILSGSTANTLSGTTIISGGTLILAKNNGVNAIQGDIRIQTGGTLSWGTSNSGSNSNNVVHDSTNIFVEGGSIIFNNRSDTFASYTQTAGGQNPSNNNSGAITITGAMVMSGGSILTINSNGRWSANSVDFTGYTTAGNVILMGGDGTNNITSFTIGSGGLIMTGQTWQVNRTVTDSRFGNEIILNGDITSSGASRIITSSSGSDITAGAVNRLNLGSAIRTWTVLSDTSTLSLPTFGTGGLIKAGAGTLAITGGAENTHTGLTTVTAGVLSFGKTAGVNAVGGDILVSGGSLTWAGSNQIPDGASITVTGGTTFVMGGATETFMNFTQTGGVGFSSSSGNSGVITIAGTASVSSGSITVNSGGRMTINRFEGYGTNRQILNIGGNTTSRITSLTIGDGGLHLTGQFITLNKGDGTNLGSEIILNGDFTGTNTNAFNANNSPAGVARINVGSAIRTFTINGGTTSVNVPIIGSGGLTKAGTATLAMTVPSTYTGKTTINAGTLTLSGTASIADSGWIQIDSGGTFDVSALAGGGFTYAPTAGTRIISGSGSVTGNLTLGGVAGLRPGSTSAAGNIATAGDGVGTLAISGNLTLTPSASSTAAAFQILSSSSADKVTIGGSLTLNANSNMVVTFDDSFVPVWGDSWDLLDWSGTFDAGGFSTGTNNRTGSDLAGNEGNLNLPDLTSWGWLWNIGPMGNGGSMTITIVPEPGRCLLLMLGLAGCFFRRRRC